MIYKIKLLKYKNIILFFVFITFMLYFVWVKFAYTISNNYFKLNNKYIDKDIVIVALDDKTINSNNFKRYQDISRTDYADILRIINYDKPKAIFTDVVFSNETKDDKKLLDIIKKNKNIVFNTEIIKKENLWVLEYKPIENVIIPKENLWYPNVNSFNILNDYLALEWESEVKNIIPIYEWNFLPSPFELYMKANNIKKATYVKNWINIWWLFIKLYKHWFNINFFTKNYPEISFIDVLDQKIPSDYFNNKVVFIWATANDIHDLFLSPISPTNFIPWVVILANAYNTLTSWKYLFYPNLFLFLWFNLFFLFNIYYFFEKFKNIRDSIFSSLIFLIIFIIIWILSFELLWIFIEIFPFLVWFIFLHIFIFINRYLSEKKSKDEIKNIFWKYISKDVVNDLLKTWIDNLKLWWQKRNITVFFSDLAWFTDLSENLNPEDLWKILNIYFEEMSSIVIDNSWTIDKFIWDAMMAFWNAPLDINNHADLACISAIKQRKAIEKVRNEIKSLWNNVFIDMRIWINTWEAVIWNFWCSKRYDYTALWDTVNLASRLEWINKQYSTNIIINETTYNEISKDKFITRELDLITVKWKLKPVKIYELLWFKEDFNKDILEKLNSYKNALEFYKNRDFKTAKEKFDYINDEPSKNFSKRCEYYISNPPNEVWDGVYKFKVK